MTRTVLIVGAGMTGLTAARALVARGIGVTVLDKGRAVGGRMATRRVGQAVFDHGAQHFSVRSEEFEAEIRSLLIDGTVRVWLRTPSRARPERGVEARHVGAGGMRRVPESLAGGLDITCGVTVDDLRFTAGRVTALSRGARVAAADGVIVTAPLPQSMALLGAAGVAPDGAAGALTEIGYDATLAVMAVLDRPAMLPDGHVAIASGPIAWIADNQHKGVSPVPAMTIHSSAGFAADHIEDDPAAWAAALVTAARPHHRGTVVDAIPHRWRYAQPRTTRDDGAMLIDAPCPVVLAGEIFSGARVEGAFTSGRAAAALMGTALGTSAGGDRESG